MYLNNRGKAYYNLKNFEEGIKDFDEAIKVMNRTNPENFFNRGNVYMSLFQFDRAHEDFDEAIRLDRSSAKLHHAKGLCYESEAEQHASKDQRDDQRDLALEDMLVSKAIECYGDALVCD